MFLISFQNKILFSKNLIRKALISTRCFISWSWGFLFYSLWIKKNWKSFLVLSNADNTGLLRSSYQNHKRRCKAIWMSEVQALWLIFCILFLTKNFIPCKKLQMKSKSAELQPIVIFNHFHIAITSNPFMVEIYKNGKMDTWQKSQYWKTYIWWSATHHK